MELHDESQHDQMSPGDVARHLIGRRGHGLSEDRIRELRKAVTQAELDLHGMTRDTGGSEELDRAQIVHDGLHRAAEDGPQVVWHHAVQVRLVARGFDPFKAEAEVDGFGDGFFDYEDDVEEFVNTILEEVGPEVAPTLRLS